MEFPLTLPTPLLIDRDVLPLTLQDKLTVWPRLTTEGDAENDEITGRGVTTIKAACCVALPALFDAVSV